MRVDVVPSGDPLNPKPSRRTNSQLSRPLSPRKQGYTNLKPLSWEEPADREPRVLRGQRDGVLIRDKGTEQDGSEKPEAGDHHGGGEREEQRERDPDAGNVWRASTEGLCDEHTGRRADSTYYDAIGQIHPEKGKARGVKVDRRGRPRWSAQVAEDRLVSE
eukprot:scaffold248279_cov36-Tisochrysis_lutea.AAC.1